LRVRLTRQADADIARILKQTRTLFGRGQVHAYAEIIELGIALIAENPSRPSCIERDSLRPGVKSFHLELVKRRRGSASHLIYFRETRAPDGEREVVIISVVHESMEPKRKLGAALRDLDAEFVPSPAPEPKRGRQG